MKIDLLNLLLICVAKFTLSLVAKSTIGTCNLASIILNFSESPPLDMMQSSILFYGTTILMIFTEPFVLLTAFVVFPTRAALYLHDWELSKVKSALLFGL